MTYTQLRYFNSEAEENAINDIEKEALQEGQNIFSNIKVTKIGIQTLPGTRFNFNGNNSCVVGSSGIWELDLSSYGQGLTIDQLAFETTSIANIEANDNAYLIIDMIYSDN